MWAALGCATAMAADVTFFSWSDTHYQFEDTSGRGEVTTMNNLPGTAYPASVGGGTVAAPRGIIMQGDLINDGARADWYPTQWANYIADFGVSGEGRCLFPVFEGIRLMSRPSTGGGTAIGTGVALTPPYWVKVVRAGNTVTGYHSPDGSSWTQVGSPVTIAMPSEIYAGLAHTSGNADSLANQTATFSGISVTGENLPMPPTISHGPSNLNLTTQSQTP
ncbi:MAG: hypothetical protein K9N23_03125 [Akkermansiaceae bacterium]|nr:hypothetical protein [Akkermansiaceae bacterium]